MKSDSPIVKMHSKELRSDSAYFLVEFHVVKSTVPLQNILGILGQEYLRQEQAEISFPHNTLVTQSDPIRPFRFVDENSLQRSLKREYFRLKLVRKNNDLNKYQHLACNY